MSDDKYQRINLLLTQLLPLLETRAFIECATASLTVLRSAAYVREGYLSLGCGELSRARNNFGWAGLYKRIANSEEREAEATWDRVESIRASIAEYKAGSHPALFDTVNEDELRGELGKLGALLNVLALNLRECAGELQDDAPGELNALREERRRQKR